MNGSFWRLWVVLTAVLVAFAAAMLVLVWSPAGRDPATLRPWTLGLGAAFVAAGGGLLWLALGRTLAPLVDFSRAVHAAAAEGDKPSARDDLQGLAAAFAQVQQRLEHRGGQLAQHSLQLQAVLASMAEGVLAVAPDKTILFANGAARRLLDFAVADPVGRMLLEVTRSRPFHDAVMKALQQGAPAETEFESPGMQRRTLSLRVARIQGEPSPGAIAVLHDVTELRRLEGHRRDFVANVSHELKTPLAAIKLCAETLRLGGLNDPEINLNFVLRIEDQAQRLHELIMDIMQLARIDSGQQTLEITDCLLVDVVDECFAQYEEAAAAKGVTLDAPLPDPELAVRAEEEGLRTILSNLIDNAVKYTPSGGRVAVRCEPHEKTIVLAVTDTGAGISEADHARIFERFFRVDKARSRELGGTGLGLSIVKNLVQAFGGAISLSSEVGRGSTFRVTLPRAPLPRAPLR